MKFRFHPRAGLSLWLLLLGGCVHAGNHSLTTKEIFLYEPPAGHTYTALVRHEIYTDSNRGGGSAFFADPRASELTTRHTNQTALGGGRTFSLGSLSSTVSTNAIQATGGAVGTGVGAIGKVLLEGH